MTIANTTLTMDLVCTIKQELSQFLNSEVLGDTESMQLALEHRNCIALSNTHLLRQVRDLANELKMVAPIVPFGTGFAEIPMIHHTNPTGTGIFLFPPSLDDNESGREIRPAYISDGFNTWVDESEDNLFLYLASNFSKHDQEELFRKILNFLKSNFTAADGNVDSSIDKCVRNFCGEIDQIINSDARE